MAAKEREHLQKTTSPAQIWALALGAMIGWGCFVLPDLHFLPTSGTMGTLSGIFIGALAVCIVALCCGMLIKIYPVAGGTFVYAYAGLGPVAAFVCGWSVVLCYTAAIAANATALVLLFRFLFPGVFSIGYMYTIMGWEIYFGELLLISAILSLFALCNIRGMSFASGIQLSLSTALVIGVIVLFTGSMTADTSTLSNLEPYFAEDKSLLASIFAIFALSPFLFGGFDTIPQAAEEFNFPPSRSISLMVMAIISGAFLYSMTLVAIAIVKPYPEQLALKSPWLVGDVANDVFGPLGGCILAVPVITAIFSGINGFFMASTRLLFGMGRSLFLPSWFSHTHKRYHTPVNAILFVWGFVLIAPWLGRPFLGWLTDTMAVSLGISYFMACITAYRLVNQRPDLVSMPMAKTVAILGLITSAACLLLLTVPGSPAALSLVAIGVCLLWIVLGILFYAKTGRNLRNTPVEEMKTMLFGTTELPVLFKTNKQ